MARPARTSVDYFPLDCSMDDSVKYIEAKHGLIGFGVLIKLWQKVYSSEGYYCEWSEKTKFLFCKEQGINVPEFEAIFITCLEENIFDKTVFQNQSVLTSRGIQKRYFKFIKESRRKELEINPKFDLLGVSSELMGVNTEETEVNTGFPPVIMPQSKVKETKVKESKVKRGTNSLSQEVYKDHFLGLAKGYYWEQKDDTHLKQLLIKLKTAFGDKQVLKNFEMLLNNLPRYWRTKKFTIPLINQNFNEIINEIQNNSDAKQNTNSNQQKFGRQTTGELADRAKSFGR